jgi:hypothetical protein
MKNASRLVIGLLVLPLLLPLVQAATGFIGGLLNLSQLNGNTIAVGVGASNTGTARTVLSSDSTVGLVAGTAQIGTVTGSTVNVTGIGGAAIPTSLATLPALVAGSANIGTVNGSSVTVFAPNNNTTAIPVSFTGGVGFSTVSVQGIYNSAVQALSNGISSLLQLDVQGNLYTKQVGAPLARNVPVQTQCSCTTSSSQCIAANANRVGLEADNNANQATPATVYINWGSIAATNTMKQIPSGGSWQPPAVSTVAVQCLSASGTQLVNVIEYNNQ